MNHNDDAISAIINNPVDVLTVQLKAKEGERVYLKNSVNGTTTSLNGTVVQESTPTPSFQANVENGPNLPANLLSRCMCAVLRDQLLKAK
jgi:hypothetical protein